MKRKKKRTTVDDDEDDNSDLSARDLKHKNKQTINNKHCKQLDTCINREGGRVEMNLKLTRSFTLVSTYNVRVVYSISMGVHDSRMQFAVIAELWSVFKNGLNGLYSVFKNGYTPLVSRITVYSPFTQKNNSKYILFFFNIKTRKCIKQFRISWSYSNLKNL